MRIKQFAFAWVESASCEKRGRRSGLCNLKLGRPCNRLQVRTLQDVLRTLLFLYGIQQCVCLSKLTRSSSDVTGLIQKIVQLEMDDRGLELSAQLFAGAQGLVEPLSRVDIVLALHHRFGQVHRTAEPIIFQAKPVSLLDGSAQLADHRLRWPSAMATRAKFILAIRMFC